MPYISPQQRRYINLNIDDILLNAGELNYKFTKVLLKYIDDHKLNYQTINDILGALEGTKLEFYRRIVINYEDEKRSLNGDVYK